MWAWQGVPVLPLLGLLAFTIVFCRVAPELIPRWTWNMQIARVGTNPWTHGLSRARDEFYRKGKSITTAGYYKYKGSMFRVQTVDMERIIVATDFAEELRKLPENVLSITEALCGRYLGWYTTLDCIRQSNLHVDVCHRHMAAKLGQLIQGEMKEMLYACDQELPPTVRGTEDSNGSAESFQFHAAYPKMFAVANRVVSRSLVGPELCRNQVWLQSNLGYLWNVFMMARALRRNSALTRPFAYLLSPNRVQVQKSLRQTQQILEPVLAAREPEDDNMDLLQWMIDDGLEERKKPKLLAQLLLVLSVAGINTTASAVTHNIFDLCVMPIDVITALRDEIRVAVVEEGGWSLAALHKMWKLDSFTRESSRMNFPGLFTFNRKVMESIRMSDGRMLAAGNYIAMPAGCVARDPDVYPDPDKFKPWRFEELRKANPGEQGNKYQLVSTNKDNLLWGHGVATCPGRMLAAAHVKAMVAFLLLHYDFCLPDGQTERPANTFEDERCIPDRTQAIGFRRRDPGLKY